jgi:hypothetical protein
MAPPNVDRGHICFVDAGALGETSCWCVVSFCWQFVSSYQRTVVTIVLLLMTLVLTGLYQYMPHHLAVMQRRSTYYLFGQEQNVLWQWVGSSAKQEM